jgi:DNA polymerase-3 subunit epsilon
MDYGLIVDLETTGTDSQQDEIIEIGILEFGVEDNKPPFVTNMYGAVAEPSQPLSPEIQRITGLDDDMLRGQTIDWNIVSRYFDRASLYVAHNADFDRAFLERQWGTTEWMGRWACSMRHIDWETHGFRTRSLNYLAADHGFVNPFAHRALFDCATTFRLIAPYFEELVARSYLKEVRILAVGTPIELKDKLKARRYRWDPQKRVWYKDVFEDRLAEERAFLAEEIYQGTPRHEEVVITDSE